jgi:DNA-directed RNA polymerase subunit RPC12/RpoP
LKHSSGRACPHCTSRDIWQPHVRTWVDRAAAKFGLQRYECRKCRRELFLRMPTRGPEAGSGGRGGESELEL